MGASKLNIEQKLHELCVETSAEFSAIAIINTHSNMIHWRFASGNINEKYKQMIAKPGKDLSGTVIRYGRVMIIDEGTFDHEKKRLDYPIMLAEKLQAAVATPIVNNGVITAVLMIGTRSIRKFSNLQITLVLSAADEFSQKIDSYNLVNYK